MKSLESRPAPLAEVLSILKSKEKEYKTEEKELLYEQKRALAHAKSMTKLSEKEAGKLVKGLTELDIMLSEERAAKIADLLPETADDVRAIFAKERFKYEEADLQKITNLVKQFA